MTLWAQAKRVWRLIALLAVWTAGAVVLIALWLTWMRDGSGPGPLG